MSAPLRFVADGLVTGLGDDLRLLAGRHRQTGQLRFPMPRGGAAAEWEEVALGTRGNLWSWTIQRFAPKQPYDGPVGEDFEPYAVGYVELPGELIVEARLVVADFDVLRLGLPLRLTATAYRHDTAGPVYTFAFEPEDNQ